MVNSSGDMLSTLVTLMTENVQLSREQNEINKRGFNNIVESVDQA
jgi:hypothetical protein